MNFARVSGARPGGINRRRGTIWPDTGLTKDDAGLPHERLDRRGRINNGAFGKFKGERMSIVPDVTHVSNCNISGGEQQNPGNRNPARKRW